ncbi:Secreted acid phosphatase [Cupriavidus taiwanensis]|uniref:Secreted acid phosphatase n=1 Tax=Cupriavidus taiwanensis TaxID=164546 RepID=A0A375EFF0_9BURK|nr:alkaline phosphatase family protein [Cupriavidus taiwanensis]SOZ73387.1 Secreted acid phosphatase [Cupriavidus taiwanensis]SOZ73900.1 Secreted acid phosphatase [Cupriavidus taiwanensis]SOZ75366.1 Secreted acid phosphatase [Cupriavidus taiwanensis]SPA03891.1 Secreted acid phosphatase [Cupriavidus taiwanensis]SPA12905.1 Secreted acid phosphatase [Cupriavidus taiwanensis]
MSNNTPYDPQPSLAAAVAEDAQALLIANSRRRDLIKGGLAASLVSMFGSSLLAGYGGDDDGVWVPKRTVMVILENKSLQELVGDPAMPYLNSLADNSALMANAYFAETPYGIAPTGFRHSVPSRGSQTNYFYLYAGNNQGALPDWFQSPGSPFLGTAYQDPYGNKLAEPIKNTPVGISNNLIPANMRPFTTPNLGAAIIQAGHTFASFSEWLPYPSFDKKGYTKDPVIDGYARRHNPVINWINLPKTDVPASKSRFVLPLSANLSMTATTDPTDGQKYPGFGIDKDGKPAGYDQLPTVSIVVPTNANNIHTGSKAACDQWLQANIKSYADWARANDSLLIVTTDEDGFTDNTNGTGPYDAYIGQIAKIAGSYQYGIDRITTLFYGPENKVARGIYRDRIDHLNVLATILDLYGALDQFKADFAQAYVGSSDLFRANEARRQLANLVPLRNVFGRVAA